MRGDLGRSWRYLLLLSLFVTACVSRPPEGALRVVWGGGGQPALLGIEASGWGNGTGTSVVELPSEEIVVAGVLDHSKSGKGPFEIPEGSPTSFVARLSRDGDVLWRLRFLACRAPVRLAAAGDDAVYVSVLGLLALGEDEVETPIPDRPARCSFGPSEANHATVLRLDGLGRVTWRVEVPGRLMPNNEPLQLLATPERVVATGRTVIPNQSVVFSLTRDGKTEWIQPEDGMLAASAWLPNGNLVTVGNYGPAAPSGDAEGQPEKKRARCFLRAFEVKTGKRLWDRPLETEGTRCYAHKVAGVKTDTVFWGVDVHDRVDPKEKGPISSTKEDWFAASVGPETGALRWQHVIDRSALSGPAEQGSITLSPEEIIFKSIQPVGRGGRQPLFIGVDARTGRARKVANLHAAPVKLEGGVMLDSLVDVESFELGREALWASGAFAGQVWLSGRQLDSPYAYRWHCQVAPMECREGAKAQAASFALFVARIPLRRR
jgi:hypothetical protein